MSTVTVNGNTYSDDGTASRDLTNGGHRQHLLPMLADAVVDLAAKADLATTNGAAQVVLAAAQADAAEAAANSAALTADVTKWISGTTYAQGDVVWSPTDLKTYRRKTNGAGTTDPTADLANWAVLIIAGNVARSARSSNTVLGAEDITTLIDITSGTFTQTFTAAATLGAGWYCYLKNSGTGDIALDPDGTETVDGLSSFVMYPGEARLIQCTGTGFTSIVLSPFSRTFIASGTFVKPPGYSQFGGLAWSAGASGQRTNSTSTEASGGGGGGCGSFLFAATALGTTESVTIGAGGAAVTGVANGNVGGNTALGSLLTVYAGTSFNNGGSILSGLVASATNIVLPYEGANANTNVGCVWGGNFTRTAGNSSRSIYGSGGGGSLDTSAVVRSPGVSSYGGNGGAAASTTSGTGGTAPGGGGGATQTGTASGAGSRGELRIWGIA